MIKNKKRSIPSLFRPFLWSYDINQMDICHDKKRIITNVLNLGTKSATDELFNIYSRGTIKRVVSNPSAGEWNKKSLNLWSLIFNTTPQKIKRKIR